MSGLGGPRARGCARRGHRSAHLRFFRRSAAPGIASLLIGLFALIAAFQVLPVAASTLRLDESSARDDVLHWIDTYRERPDAAQVPAAMKLLSQRGVLRDPDSAGVYVGFLAGILGANPDAAETITGKVLAGLPAEDQWIVVRGLAYSGLPQWKATCCGNSHRGCRPARGHDRPLPGRQAAHTRADSSR